MDNGELTPKGNAVRDKSFALAQYLQGEKREYALSKQVLRSGTAVGALVREPEHAQGKADFISKMSIALKEANETACWIELLYQSQYIDAPAFESIWADTQEVLRLLIAIVKTSRGNNGKLTMENRK